MKPKIIFFSFIVLVPELSFAIGPDLNSASCFVLKTLALVDPILFGIALLVFFWGIAQFILNAADTKQHAAGRQIMIWGVIALFCLVAWMGILQFLSNQLEFGTVGTPLLPTGSQTTSSCEGIASINTIFRSGNTEPGDLTNP